MKNSKQKVTFCLSQRIVKDLEDIQYQLRQKAKDLTTRNRITKSSLVALGLQTIYDDFKAKKTEGYLKNIC